MKNLLLTTTLVVAVTFSSGSKAQSAPAQAPAAVQKLADQKQVDAGTDVDYNFTLPEIASGQQVRLATDARVQSPEAGGCTYYMEVTVNGTKIPGPSLINKAPDVMLRNGMDMPWYQFGAWNLVYAPDFSDQISTAPIEYGVVSPHPYHYVWDITPYSKSGQNTVRFHQNILLNPPPPLVLRNVTVEHGSPLPNPPGVGVQGAPQGPLPAYVATKPAKVAMGVELSDDGRIRVNAAGRSFQVNSRTSLPAGGWTKPQPKAKWNKVGNKSQPVTWLGSGYKVSRRVEKANDYLRVFDTITNTGKKLAGIIIENRLAVPKAPQEILLAGRPIISETSFRETPSHPTAFARWADYAVGLVAEDDIFRVHNRAFTEPGAIGLSDPRLGLAPSQSRTLEWSIYLQPRGDYWSFINAVRRNWGSNFKMESATFDFNGSSTRRPEAEQLDWVTSRRLGIVISTQSDFTREEVKTVPALAADPILSKVPQGTLLLAEGTAIPMAKTWNEIAARWIAINKTASEKDKTLPPVRSVVYLDPNICSEPGAMEKYADSKVMDASGKHLTTPYSFPLYLYLPTLTSSYGKALMETVKYIVNDVKADGIYMDEFSSGSVPAYIYHTEWDGCSLEIDEKTHAIKGKKSSSVLLQQPWRDMMIKYLRAHGKTIIANTNAATRTATRWQVQFTGETVSYSTLIESHLGTPWGLANHNPTYDQASQAQMARRILDYSGLPCVYSWPDRPDQPHFLSLMNPITPEQIGVGMVHGKERIVTNRSGRYGWHDGGAATVYVFDGGGNLVAKPNVRLVTKGKQTLTELRMPSDHFAVLVKRQQKK